MLVVAADRRCSQCAAGYVRARGLTSVYLSLSLTCDRPTEAPLLRPLLRHHSDDPLCRKGSRKSPSACEGLWLVGDGYGFWLTVGTVPKRSVVTDSGGWVTSEKRRGPALSAVP